MRPVVFLPGLLCDSALWQAQTGALADGAHALIPPLDQHDSITALAAEVLAAAPATFALVGLSMGGYVAFEILRQAPERIERLALFDTSARPDTPEQKEKRRALIQLSRTGKFKGVTPRLLPMLIHPAHMETPAITETIIAMANRIGKEGFQRQQHAIMNRPDSRPLLPAIKCPALIAVGNEDQLTPPEIASEMAGLIPQARLEIIPQCGHLPPLEQPEKTTALLRAWLA